MSEIHESTCPGCGLKMPVSETAVYDGYYNTSPECWSVYTEVLGAEFGNALLYGQVHQLSVDAYAVQHAGGAHPDKSIDIHLAGLHLVLERGIGPPYAPPYLKQLADAVKSWLHFPAPEDRGSVTVCDVALSSDPEEHIKSVRKWAGTVWEAWSAYHGDVAEFVHQYLKVDPDSGK